jgi:hypothetical protein
MNDHPSDLIVDPRGGPGVHVVFSDRVSDTGGALDAIRAVLATKPETRDPAALLAAALRQLALVVSVTHKGPGVIPHDEGPIQVVVSRISF